MEQIKEDSAVKILDNDTEELFIKYKNETNVENRNAIVDKYFYLTEIISKKFINRGVEYDDIYQVASIALIKAVERFSLDKSVKFVTYATPTIIGEIKRFFRDKASVIRIPRKIYEIYQTVNNAKEYLSQKLNRNPRVDEIAEYLNVDEETVLETMESWNVYNIESFNRNVYSDDDLELHETIGKEDSTFERIENRDFVEKSIDKLNEIEKQFIKMRYVDDKNQKDIANKLGVSQMYISRLERKVINKFRKILSK